MVLFTFPSRYWCAIGRRLVFSLVGWAPRIRTGFHVSRPTWDAAGTPEASRTGLSPSAAGLSRPLRSRLRFLAPSRNPAGQARRFGLLRVRSPLLAESLLISLPPGTEMFHFPGCASAALWIQAGMAPFDRCRIAPFGNPWIKGRLRLPTDYRGLPRPSSPAVAKASVMRPNSLSAKISRTRRPAS